MHFVVMYSLIETQVDMVNLRYTQGMMSAIEVYMKIDFMNVIR